VTILSVKHKAEQVKYPDSTMSKQIPDALEQVTDIFGKHGSLGPLSKSELEALLIGINVAPESAKKITEIVVKKGGTISSKDFVDWVFNVSGNQSMDNAAMMDSSGESESDQLAKCMANIERLRRELNANQLERVALGLPALTDKRKSEVASEMKSRKKKCKELCAKGVIPSPTICVFNQIDLDKTRKITGKGINRLVRGMTTALGKKFEVEPEDQIMSVLDADKSGDIDIAEWCDRLPMVPKLYNALKADVDPTWGTLLSFRTPEEQLAKCMGNIERLRRELFANQDERKAVGFPVLTDARKAAIEKEMVQRKQQCKKYRALGIVPAPNYCVFNQLDVEKNRRLDKGTLDRMVKGLNKALASKYPIEGIDKIMNVLDTDKSGDIDESEFVINIKKLPKLYKALDDDLDKEYGVLHSFRTPEDQLAKCMGNLQRLKRQLSTNEQERKALGLPVLTADRKEKIEAEIRSRKNHCKKWRAMGIIPSPGYCVFSQVDVDHTKRLSRAKIERVVKALVTAYGSKVEIEDMDTIMKTLDEDRSDDISEHEWMMNLEKCPKLNKALFMDMDPDYGVLNCFRTPEDQLAKCMGNLQRLKRELNASPMERKEQNLAPLTAERKAAIEAEIRSRKDLCKKFRAQGVVPAPGYCAFTQVDIDKTRQLSRAKLERVVKSMVTAYGTKYQIEDLNTIMNTIDKDNSGTISESEWILHVKECKNFYKALQEDVDPDYGVLNSFRAPEDQLAKCMGNIQRLKRELDANPAERKELNLPLLTEERKAAIQAEMRSRKDLCKKFRAQGVVPSPGYCAFNQVDIDKTRHLSRAKLERVVKAMVTAYGTKYEVESLDTIMNTIDKDNSGDISESEWVLHVKECPNFYKALQDDIDPDYGVLSSFRTPEDQLAKCMGNLARLKAELDAGPNAERKAAIEREMATRKELCKKFRAQGVMPTPGYCVFNQIDTEKKRVLSKDRIASVVAALKEAVGMEIEDVDIIMKGLDKDGSNDISEHEFCLNLKDTPLFLKALQANIDPDYGVLKCIPGDKI
jgi:Ca2+-binding EF-hand superfamily protein